MIQVNLKAHDTHLTCWVDKDVKIGDRVTLKHAPAVLWDVIWAGQPTDVLPNRGWNVGGIGR